LDAEVTRISRRGFWLVAGGRELFVAFADFPWFEDAPVRHVLHVELPSPGHLRWPDLDVDLAVESLENPEAFPLVSRALRKKSPRPSGGARKARRARGRARTGRG
jgi:hypothetical protein